MIAIERDIKGIEDLTFAQIQTEVLKGGKFIEFPYCISMVILSFKLSSGPILLRAEDQPFKRGLRYFFLSLLLGWWGIPHGPIYTLQSIYYFFRGGKDLTEGTLAYLRNPPLPFYHFCPGCTNFAYGRGVCTKHTISVKAYPERFHECCEGRDFSRMPILLPTIQCYACGATVTLTAAERVSLAFSCPHCKVAYDFRKVSAATNGSS